MYVNDILERVREGKPYTVEFKLSTPRIKILKEKYVTQQSIILPNFSISPLYISEANFYASQWKLELKLVNKIQNTSWRTIRRGYGVHGINVENVDIGNFSTSIPHVPRHSSENYTVTASKQGLGSGAFTSLVQAFLTGHVSGTFNIDAKACAFLLCTEKQFHIRGVFPVKKVNVTW